MAIYDRLSDRTNKLSDICRLQPADSRLQRTFIMVIELSEVQFGLKSEV